MTPLGSECLQLLSGGIQIQCKVIEYTPWKPMRDTIEANRRGVGTQPALRAKSEVIRLSLGILLLIALGTDDANAQRIPDSLFRVGWTDTRELRRSQAAEWVEEISAIDKEIPTLSPAEAAWIKVEYDDQLASNGGRFTARASRALQSREYLSREGRKFTTSLLMVLRPLAGTRPLAEREEMRLWAALCFYALDQASWSGITGLGELGIVQRDPKQKPRDGHYEALMARWAIRVQAITGKILEPFLRRPQE